MQEVIGSIPIFSTWFPSEGHSVIDMLEQKRKLSRFLTHSKQEQIPRYAPRVFMTWGRRKQERAHGGCLWLGKAMKGAASCEKLRGGASGL